MARGRAVWQRHAAMRFWRLLVLGAAAACGSSSAAAPVVTPEETRPLVDASATAKAADDAGAVDSGADARVIVCDGKPGAAGDFDRSLTSGGRTRTYELHVPPSYDPTRPASLVVAFHGFTRDGQEMHDVTHFSEVADQKGFVVAFPDGVSGSWNAGVCCGIAAGTGVDDVGFVADLVDSLLAEYCVDPKRVFATGFSNGGFLSHRLACELSNKIAAVASVSGVMGVQTCAPPRAVPVLQIHGTSDPVVPYNGNALLGYPSVDTTIGGWVSRNGCGAKREVSRTGSTHCDAWDGCRDAGDVELCTVDGGDHGWPGGGSLWTDAGPPAGFVASTTIIDFFDRHPMR